MGFIRQRHVRSHLSFQDQYGDRRFRYTEVNDHQAWVDELNRKINEERNKTDTGTSRHGSEERGGEERNAGHDRIVHYRQVQYYRYPEKNVAEAAKYLEDHPEVNLIVTGYADVQTGNPAYNLKLSQRRAEAVCNMMVKEFGVDPSRIRVDYKG